MPDDRLERAFGWLRAAPPSPADPDLPAPVSVPRIVSWFVRHGYAWFVDGDGHLGGIWNGRLYLFLLIGERQEILHVRARWHRDLAIERLPEVLEICNRWNTERLWPKCYARVRDDGKVQVTCEVSTDLGDGVTDEQLAALLRSGTSTATMFLDALDRLYPDPALAAP